MLVIREGASRVGASRLREQDEALIAAARMATTVIGKRDIGIPDRGWTRLRYRYSSKPRKRLGKVRFGAGIVQRRDRNVDLGQQALRESSTAIGTFGGESLYPIGKE
jgi:hypothetical protein